MKKKLKITDLEVKSFSTSLDPKTTANIKGGAVQTLPLVDCLGIPQYTEPPFYCIEP
ncbi:MAG: pinensin family lanthipeptide [Luteibaculum sp.]